MITGRGIPGHDQIQNTMWILWGQSQHKNSDRKGTAHSNRTNVMEAGRQSGGDWQREASTIYEQSNKWEEWGRLGKRQVLLLTWIKREEKSRRSLHGRGIIYLPSLGRISVSILFILLDMTIINHSYKLSNIFVPVKIDTVRMVCSYYWKQWMVGTEQLQLIE